MNERIFIMTLTQAQKTELLEVAKHCMNHHHGCDCREAHWLSLVDNLECERDKAKKHAEALVIELLQVRNELAQARIETALASKEKMTEIMRAIAPPYGMPVSEWCSKTHIQLCHCCDNLECEDNMKNNGGVKPE